MLNKLILGDSIETLKTLDSDTIDLIYLFFSNTARLGDLVREMYRILKNDGSLCAHCGQDADAVRADIFDTIFGKNNFRGNITYHADTILYYSKSEYYTNEPLYRYVVKPYNKNNGYTHNDHDGRGMYKLNSLEAHHDGFMYTYKEYKPPKNGWKYYFEEMEQLDHKGRLYFSENLSQKIYLDVSEKELIGNDWSDIREKEMLLERVIKRFSKRSGIVLDPFMGDGIAIAVAERMERRWIGIDTSVTSVKAAEFRLQKQMNAPKPVYTVSKEDEYLFVKPDTNYIVQLQKYHYDSIRTLDPFTFESWIIKKYGGHPHGKKGPDNGVDGVMPDETPIQVKRVDKAEKDVITIFTAAIKKYFFGKTSKKLAGYIIAFDFTADAKRAVSQLKNAGISIHLVQVKDVAPLAENPVKPNVAFEKTEIRTGIPLVDAGKQNVEFTVTNKNSDIAFYSWDFAYSEEKGFRASILIDEEGKQKNYFSIGKHTVAVKAVDTNGFESMESITVSI